MVTVSSHSLWAKSRENHYRLAISVQKCMQSLLCARNRWTKKKDILNLLVQQDNDSINYELLKVWKYIFKKD